MKTLIRSYLINLAALFLATVYVGGLTYSGGFNTLAMGALVLMLINLTIVPLLKVLLLPLNLLTFGFFAWVVNVIALYFLTVLFPQIQISPYFFQGLNLGGIVIPAMQLSTLQVAIIASFMIGFISHFMHWLVK